MSDLPFRVAMLTLLLVGVPLGCNGIMGFDEGQPLLGGSGGQTATGTSTGSPTGSPTGTGTGTSTGTGTGSPSGLVPYECESCVATSCGAAMAACEGDAECSSLADCWIGCIEGRWSEGCIWDCVDANPSGRLLLLQAMVCWFANCHTQCLGPGCGIWEIGALDNTACQACLDETCSSECVTCEQNPECIKYSLCLYSCHFDQACNDACASAYGDGMADYDAMWGMNNPPGCGNSNTGCAAECSF